MISGCINAHTWQLHVRMCCEGTCSSIHFIADLIQFTISAAARPWVSLNSTCDRKKNLNIKKIFLEGNRFY